MLQIQDGQCGKCAHFGDDHGNDEKLVQIRISGQASPEVVEPCGHPDNARLSLQVTPVSGCAGYTPAKVA
ncbi:MAG: hypothetical protein AAFX05_01010 [Planctomycetota bacterium]